MTDHGHTAFRAARWRLPALLVALVIAAAALVLARFQILDPYRPGTSHRVLVNTNGCANPGGLHLDGRSWWTTDHAPTHWPNPQPDVQRGGTWLPGELEVTDPDLGVFTADIGGSVTFHRIRAGAFLADSCAVE